MWKKPPDFLYRAWWHMAGAQREQWWSFLPSDTIFNYCTSKVSNDVANINLNAQKLDPFCAPLPRQYWLHTLLSQHLEPFTEEIILSRCWFSLVSLVPTYRPRTCMLGLVLLFVSMWRCVQGCTLTQSTFLQSIMCTSKIRDHITKIGLCWALHNTYWPL